MDQESPEEHLKIMEEIENEWNENSFQIVIVYFHKLNIYRSI